MHEATVNGYDAALRNVYAISGVSALENQWRRHLHGLPVQPKISQRRGLASGGIRGGRRRSVERRIRSGNDSADRGLDGIDKGDDLGWVQALCP